MLTWPDNGLITLQFGALDLALGPNATKAEPIFGFVELSFNSFEFVTSCMEVGGWLHAQLYWTKNLTENNMKARTFSILSQFLLFKQAGQLNQLKLRFYQILGFILSFSCLFPPTVYQCVPYVDKTKIYIWGAKLLELVQFKPVLLPINQDWSLEKQFWEVF